MLNKTDTAEVLDGSDEENNTTRDEFSKSKEVYIMNEDSVDRDSDLEDE